MLPAGGVRLPGGMLPCFNPNAVEPEASMYWDGTDSSNNPVSRGIYTYNLEASQTDTNNTYPELQTTDYAAYRSQMLTISDVTVAGLNDNRTDYARVRVSYTLSDVFGTAASECKVQIWGYIRPAPNTTAEWTMVGESAADASLGSHYVDLTMLRSAIANVEGSLAYVVFAKDDQELRTRSHNERWALELGRQNYSKILDIPHYDQTGDVDGDGWYDEDPAHILDGEVNPPYFYYGQDNDGDGPVDEDPVKGVWCGEATAKSWIDYKTGFTSADYNRYPTELNIANFVIANHGYQYYWNNNPPDGVWQPWERGMVPSEYAEVLNYYLSTNKYHRDVRPTATDVMAREAYLIATAQEPSAAVIYTGGHYVLVSGVLCQSDPSWGATTVHGVWVHDPGSPVSTPLPIYIAASSWLAVFTSYTDVDGITGYIHVEDPPPGDDRLDHLPPFEFIDLHAQGQAVTSETAAIVAAEAAVSANMLDTVGPLSSTIKGTTPGIPVLVEAPDSPFGSYYIVPLGKNARTVATAVISASDGSLVEVAACSANWRLPDLSSRDRALSRARVMLQSQELSAQLTWSGSCMSSRPNDPYWLIETPEHQQVAIDARGNPVPLMQDRTSLNGAKTRRY